MLFDDLAYNFHILKAMATHRKKGIDFVNSLLNQIIRHLVKIALYNERDRDIQVQGWEVEILVWLDEIDYKCNNLKGNKSLTLKDYTLCLNDDLGNDGLMFRTIRNVKRKMSNVTLWVEIPPPDLRLLVYDILQSQFKAMAQGKWSENLLLENESYKQIKT